MRRNAGGSGNGFYISFGAPALRKMSERAEINQPVPHLRLPVLLPVRPFSHTPHHIFSSSQKFPLHSQEVPARDRTHLRGLVSFQAVPWYSSRLPALAAHSLQQTALSFCRSPARPPEHTLAPCACCPLTRRSSTSHLYFAQLLSVNTSAKLPSLTSAGF